MNETGISTNAYELANELSLIYSEYQEEQNILIACVNKLREQADALQLERVIL